MISSVIASVVLRATVAAPFSFVKTFPGLKIAAVAAGTANRFAIALEGGEVKIMDDGKMESVATLSGHRETVTALAYSSDGKLLVTGDDFGKLILWNGVSGAKLREFPRGKGHTKGVHAIAFAPGNKQFASVARDDTMRLWNVAGGDPVTIVNGEGLDVYGVGFTASGSVVVGTLAEGMRVLTKGGEVAAKVSNPGEGCNHLATNRAGTLAVGTGRDGKVIFYSLGSKSVIKSVQGHSDYAKSVAVSPTGRYAASASSDSTVAIWELSGYSKVAGIEGMASNAPMAFTADGKYFVTANAASELTIYTAGSTAPAPKAKKAPVAKKKKGKG